MLWTPCSVTRLHTFVGVFIFCMGDAELGYVPLRFATPADMPVALFEKNQPHVCFCVPALSVGESAGG